MGGLTVVRGAGCGADGDDDFAPYGDGGVVPCTWGGERGGGDS